MLHTAGSTRQASCGLFGTLSPPECFKLNHPRTLALALRGKMQPLRAWGKSSANFLSLKGPFFG